jgi:hypothetical protein
MTVENYYQDAKKLVGQNVVTWASMAASVNGEPFEYSKFTNKTLQVFGTFGGTVTIQGSNDPRVLTDPGNAVWATLTADGTNALTFTAVGMKKIHENPRFIRPSNGSGITATTVIINAIKE